MNDEIPARADMTVDQGAAEAVAGCRDVGTAARRRGAGAGGNVQYRKVLPMAGRGAESQTMRFARPLAYAS
jgi:hypothetical protein